MTDLIPETFEEAIADLEVITDLKATIAVIAMNRGATPAEARPLDVDKAVLALLLGVAAMIELDIRLAPSDRRRAIDAARDTLKNFVDGMEHYREASGRSFLETLGLVTGAPHQGGN